MNCYTYQQIQLGQEESFTATLTQEKIQAFCSITADENPLHTDAAYAQSQGYDERVVYGMLTASFFSTLAGMYLPGKYSLIHSVEVKFPKATYLSHSDRLTVRGTVIEKNDLFKLITLKVSIEDSRSVKVCRGMMKVGVMDGK